jgi:dTDP-4-dehydrorhamnose 3,5-epimerase
MTVIDLPIEGAKVLSTAPFRDARGTFEVFWEQADLQAAGMLFVPASACHSYNQKAGMLRGMHFQRVPYGQTKLVSCVQGSAWDVMVDLRPASPTYLRWHGETLEPASGRTVFVPAGCAHGFLALKDETTIAYLIAGDYKPAASEVVRWNDPAFGIEWPMTDPVLSERDRVAPDFVP